MLRFVYACNLHCEIATRFTGATLTNCDTHQKIVTVVFRRHDRRLNDALKNYLNVQKNSCEQFSAAIWTSRQVLRCLCETHTYEMHVHEMKSYEICMKSM